MEYGIGSAQLAPQLFADMRCKRSQKDYRRLQCFLVDPAVSCHIHHFVGIFHKAGNYRIEAEVFQSGGDFMDHFVAYLHHFLRGLHAAVLIVHNQIPETVQETIYAVDSSVVPFRIQLRRSYKKLVHS